MKILINALSARQGGGRTYLLNLLQHIDPSSEAEIYILAPESLDISPFPWVTRVTVDWPTRNPLLRTLWENLRLPTLLREMNIDILFCPGGLITTRPPVGCRTVTMFRNMIPFDPMIRGRYPLGLTRIRNWLLERSMLASMAKADLVIFISSFARRVIEERLQKRLRHAVTIPHGINDHFRIRVDAAPPRPDWLPVSDYLLYVSFFDVYKNQCEVVRGYHLMKTHRKTHEKLILAGDHSTPYASLVLDEIRRLGLQNDVVMPGNIRYQDLPAVYANAKVNIFASTCENCPNILLEALGAGRPTLVSECQPMPEFGGDAVTYFNPWSPEDFAAKLINLLDDEGALAAFSEKARNRAKLYDWRLTAHATWRTITSLA